MDYPCGKFGDCSFSPFWFYRAGKQTHRHTPTDADERYTPAIIVGVSNWYRRYFGSILLINAVWNCFAYLWHIMKLVRWPLISHLVHWRGD